ncbi:MAG: hypothetical protein EOM20_11735 [Spartobacteria bacterium]|nr:hypothetical protein [Spartobacteria bacterium]
MKNEYPAGWSGSRWSRSGSVWWMPPAGSRRRPGPVYWFARCARFRQASLQYRCRALVGVK